MFEADTSSELVVRALRPRDASALQEAHENLLPLEYERSFYLGVCGDEESTDCSRNGDQVVFALGALESRRCEQKLVGFVTARVETYGSKAEDEGIILPFAWEHWLWERRRIVYILTLGVEKRFRRRGVASRLVRSVLRVAKESYGCMLAYLHAIEYNEEAAGFYRSVGFTKFVSVNNQIATDDVRTRTRNRIETLSPELITSIGIFSEDHRYLFADADAWNAVRNVDMKTVLFEATEHILGASGALVFESSCLWTACTLFFLALVHFACVRARYGWTKKVQLAVCCMAGIHGTTATLLSAREILLAWPISMDMVNTNNQERAVFLSTGYFAFDFLHLILMQPHELTFILHHLIVTVYMISSVVIGRGLISSLVMMCIGEVTNMFLNVWLIAKDTRKEYKGASEFFDRFSPYFTVVYVFFRTILGPPITFWVIHGLISSPVLPPPLKYGWSILIALGTLGSQVWSLKLVKNTLRKRKSQTKMA